MSWIENSKVVQPSESGPVVLTRLLMTAPDWSVMAGLILTLSFAVTSAL